MTTIDRIRSLERALDIAALRFDQIALDFGLGHERCLEISEYGSEARAALSHSTEESGDPAPVQRLYVARWRKCDG